jgi:AcrR family transcriptional regulator
MRHCPICENREKAPAVDNDIHEAKMSLQDIANKHSFTKATVYNHKLKHVVTSLVNNTEQLKPIPEEFKRMSVEEMLSRIEKNLIIANDDAITKHDMRLLIFTTKEQINYLRSQCELTNTIASRVAEMNQQIIAIFDRIKISPTAKANPMFLIWFTESLAWAKEQK